MRVRFVRDASGPLEDKAKRVVITIARDHEEALRRVRAYFAEVAEVGVTLDYGDPSRLSDTIALESLVYA